MDGGGKFLEEIPRSTGLTSGGGGACPSNVFFIFNNRFLGYLVEEGQNRKQIFCERLLGWCKDRER